MPFVLVFFVPSAALSSSFLTETSVTSFASADAFKPATSIALRVLRSIAVLMVVFIASYAAEYSL